MYKMKNSRFILELKHKEKDSKWIRWWFSFHKRHNFRPLTNITLSGGRQLYLLFILKFVFTKWFGVHLAFVRASVDDNHNSACSLLRGISQFWTDIVEQIYMSYKRKRFVYKMVICMIFKNYKEVTNIWKTYYLQWAEQWTEVSAILFSSVVIV